MTDPESSDALHPGEHRRRRHAADGRLDVRVGHALGGTRGGHRRDRFASVVDRIVDDQLVQVRLGIAASLFAVLRCKHPPTAAHMLRVALTTSAWCLKLRLGEAQRDTIEVAALLHDLGVIGVPDRILQKPGILSTNEALTVERSRRMSAVILGCSCTDPAVLDVVETSRPATTAPGRATTFRAKRFRWGRG